MALKTLDLVACGGRKLRTSLARSRAALAWRRDCSQVFCSSRQEQQEPGNPQHPSTSTSSSASYYTISSSRTATSSSSGNSGSTVNTFPSSAPFMHIEKINPDGSLTVAQQYSQYTALAAAAATSSSRLHSQQHQHQQYQQHQRPPGLPAAAPAAPPISQEQLEQLVDIIQGSKRVVVVTGAGCSTESNIPDYRGAKGAYTTGFKPMTHQQFLAAPQNRARYWARSFAGWHEFAFVPANPAHEGIARLQEMGWLDMVITQNVDRLHHKGGSSSSKVLELHGTTHRVVCLQCGHNSCRHDLQQRLSDLNPALAEQVRRMSAATAGISNRDAYERALRAGTAADGNKVAAGKNAEQVPVVRPDGDVELVDAGAGFKVADCQNCGSQMLKPDVVFFGDAVPKDRVETALSAVQSCDLLLVVGSSLMVWSAFRLAKAAHESGAALAIVNVGPTRADELASFKVEALAGEVLTQLARHPRLLLPRLGCL